MDTKRDEKGIPSEENAANQSLLSNTNTREVSYKMSRVISRDFQEIENTFSKTDRLKAESTRSALEQLSPTEPSVQLRAAEHYQEQNFYEGNYLAPLQRESGGQYQRKSNMEPIWVGTYNSQDAQNKELESRLNHLEQVLVLNNESPRAEQSKGQASQLRDR
jgi:hypothetical protein